MHHDLAGGFQECIVRLLSHRFQIQDIVTQDLSGVVFHALDVETGKPVAVRRFFPFGVDGGGLINEERDAYNNAVEQLAGLKHPGLRAVLAGGCDPVDGMPFVVTEWIEGESLTEILQRAVFAPAAAIAVLDRLLELSETLSQTLGRDAVWLETSPSMIFADREEQGRGFTFCLSPVKWLGLDASQRGMLVVAELAEDLLGWRGRIVSGQAGNGLGAWVKWLRESGETITLFQARESLANFTGGRSPQPTKAIEPATPALTLLEKPPSRRPKIIIAVLSLLVVIAGWWVIRHPGGSAALTHSQQAATKRQADKLTAATPQDAQSKLLAKVNAQALALSQTNQQPEPSGIVQVFQIADSAAILNEKGREVTVEGTLQNVRLSNSGKTLYLEFSQGGSGDEVRGSYRTESADAEMTVPLLQQLVGKHIQLTGVVGTEAFSKIKRPEIWLKDRKAIKEVK